MHGRSISFLAIALLGCGLVTAAGCSDDDPEECTGDDCGGASSGGTPSVGGSTSKGGTSSKGGTTSKGGSTSVAGAAGTAPATGGTANTGGAVSAGTAGTAPATGGAVSTGGTANTGGAVSAGTAGKAGAPSTGGAVSTGGAAGAATGGATTAGAAGTPATGGATTAGTAGTNAAGATSVAGSTSTAGTTSAAGAGGTAGTAGIATGGVAGYQIGNLNVAGVAGVLQAPNLAANATWWGDGVSTAGTGNLPRLFVSSVEKLTGNLPSSIVDNNTSTFWVSGWFPTASRPEIFGLEFAAPVTISAVIIRGRPNGDYAYNPSDFTIETSDTGQAGSWTVQAVLTRDEVWPVATTSGGWPAALAPRVSNRPIAVQLYAPVTAKWVRLVVTHAYCRNENGSTCTNTQVEELQVR